MKKRRLEVMSFNKAELFNTGNLTIEQAGVSIPVEDIEKFNDTMAESFGFFTGNDGNKYFPTLTGNDLVPKEEDFVNAPFRLLSAGIVAGGSWRATNFGANEGVLRASMEKLIGKPVFYDHDTDLMNWTGFVKSVKWTESTVSSTGTRIPAGIDGILALDGKTNPKLARGVLMKAIFSNSVTVLFEWEPSHDFESDDDFMRNIGQVGSDGKMITRNVTKIHDYHESSLVWLGADPFAKLIDEDGDLVNIDESSVVSFSKENDQVKELYQKDKKYSINSCLSKSVCISLTSDGYNFGVSSKKEEKNTMKKEVLNALGKVLNCDPATLSVEDVTQIKLVGEGQEAIDSTELQALKDDAGKVEGLTTEVADLKKGKGELEASEKTLKDEAEANEPFVEAGKGYINLKREEVKRLYKVSAGDNVDETVLELFDDAKPDQLEGLLAQYTKDSTLKFKGKCNSCGSEEFSFRSSLSSAEEEEVETSSEELGTSFDDIYENSMKKKPLFK